MNNNKITEGDSLKAPLCIGRQREAIDWYKLITEMFVNGLASRWLRQGNESLLFITTDYTAK